MRVASFLCFLRTYVHVCMYLQTVFRVTLNMYRCTEPGIGRLLASRKRTNSSFKDAAWHSANGLNGYNVNAHRKPLLLAIRDTRRKLIDALDRVTLKQARFHDYYVTQVFCNRILDFRMCNESMLRVDFSNNTVDIVRISDTGISGRCRMRRCFRRKREREKERERRKKGNLLLLEICACTLRCWRDRRRP